MLLDLEPSMPGVAFPPPRPFQASTRLALREAIKAGHRHLIVCSPTGSGKTMLAMYLIHETLRNGKKAIFVADRITLIDQTSATATKHGLRYHGIMQANHLQTNPDLPFQIASAQTLANRQWPDADLIIIDEAHTQLKAWTEHIKTARGIVIGLSATPFSTGLGNHFTYLHNAVTMAELVAEKTLVPMRVFAAKRPDMTNAATAGGEWTHRAAGERGSKIVGDVVTEWLKHGQGRKTICFGATVKHCEELARQFNEAGVMARVYCQHTPDSERREMVEEFKRPDADTRILISVEALAKGFDVPDVGCIIDCRPLRKSFSTYVQMIGRGLRSSPETGKIDCIVLDHSGNSLRFAADFNKLYHEGLDQLNHGEKLDKEVRKDQDDKTPAGCPQCGTYPFIQRCLSCGFALPPQPVAAHEPGVLEEIVLGGKTLAANHTDLFSQLVTYAQQHSHPDKVWMRARHLYREIVGEFPPPQWSLDRVKPMPVTSATLGKVKSINIRRAKSRFRGAYAV